MDFFEILAILGSIASIVGLILYINHYKTKLKVAKENEFLNSVKNSMLLTGNSF